MGVILRASSYSTQLGLCIKSYFIALDQYIRIISYQYIICLSLSMVTWQNSPHTCTHTHTALCFTYDIHW